MAQWLTVLATFQRENLSSGLSTHVSSQLPITPTPGLCTGTVAYIFRDTHT